MIRLDPRRRRLLMLAGVLPALLVAAFAVHVALMRHHDSAGRAAYDDADYAAATDHFLANQSRNWLQPWIAHFDEGTSLHTDGAWPDAIAAYETALESVPRRDECTVRINLALVHEAVGDLALEKGATGDALDAWQAGITALAGGDCPTDSGRGEKQTEDAAEVDERLRKKMEEAKPEPQQPPPNNPGEDPEGDQSGPDPREERLERNNKQGLEQRRDDEELYRDRDYSRPNSW
ncbi:hypothetical protein JK386_05865 [Nocardioides sp. zg-536]|uniref:Tetratricopeptide repeat protein n=1 Tax=Nocardioides faecalis TaxID=2803858 RepID=A0A938Y041_9ACTN|nr:hypothetical protein [Nocardioides faecalis]MBM9459421.1 hypothetical protein [Nocardioides faecalis]MBS4751662.1 hypothetical protein [Nocardioides faecalis]QVI59472.1 hypothetical protein KG111_03650 [Nocardioides faecalis]